MPALMVIDAKDDTHRASGLFAFKDIEIGKRGIVGVLGIERERVRHLIHKLKFGSILAKPIGETPVPDVR
jgi:hypothetical protein